jgi:hypothetical protein
MKQFFTLALIAGALMLSAPSQARMVSTRAQCVASCGTALSDTCGWITKRGKFNACKNKLYRQCRKWGTDAMCPPPPPPTTTTTVPAPVVTTPTRPAPVVTTTTRPAVTTTSTTVPYVPPTTTTTLPSIPDLRGSYTFSGSVVSDPCGVLGYGAGYALPFSVTSQSGTSLSGTIGAQHKPATGDLYDDDSWNLSTSYYDYSTGCTYAFGIAVGDVNTPAYGYLIFGGSCSTVACIVEFEGTVY